LEKLHFTSPPPPPSMFHRFFNFASKVKKKIAMHPNQVS
jgi:hypothetical protein